MRVRLGLCLTVIALLTATAPVAAASGTRGSWTSQQFSLLAVNDCNGESAELHGVLKTLSATTTDGLETLRTSMVLTGLGDQGNRYELRAQSNTTWWGQSFLKLNNASLVALGSAPDQVTRIRVSYGPSSQSTTITCYAGGNATRLR